MAVHVPIHRRKAQQPFRVGTFVIALVMTTSIAAPAVASSSASRPTVAGHSAAGLTISGMAANTLVSTLGSKSKLVAAIAPVAKSQAIPITSAAEARLRWLAAGHLREMTLEDAAVGYEIASLPLTPQVTPGAASLLNVSPVASSISCGTTYNGVENSNHYSDIVGFAVVVDAGLTGMCNGPGHGAIVHWGNFLDGINNGIPDGCNNSSPHFFHKGEVYNGSYPEWWTMLNTFESGANTPFGCVGSGSDAAAAVREEYNGHVDAYDDWNTGWGQPGWGNQSFPQGPYTCCGKVEN